MRCTQGFWTVTGLLLAGALAGAGVFPGSARAESVVLPPRPGQVGVSVSGLYGRLLQTGDFGEAFTSGPGLAVRLRYRMRYERGFGLTFEAHGLDPRSGFQFVDPYTGVDIPPDSSVAPRRLNLYLYGVDFYQMFGTRTKTTRMLSVGAGIAHPTRTLNDGQTDFPGGDGLYASAGAGLERFFWQSWAWDLTARYQAIFHEGKTNHDLQVSAGVIFYASR
jgi:hypothetical protein